MKRTKNHHTANMDDAPNPAEFVASEALARVLEIKRATRRKAFAGDQDAPLYERVLNNNNFIPKICFTTCLDRKFIPGAVGLIKSIRKLYSPDEADIIVFLKRPSEAFSSFCAHYSAEIRYFGEIEEWALPLIYADPKYANDTTHAYHPDFKPAANVSYNPSLHSEYTLRDGLKKKYRHEPGFDRIRHLDPVHVKAYSTGYCICIRNYEFVAHIDSDAFLLSRIDAAFDQFGLPDTAIVSTDYVEDLNNVELLYDVPLSDDFRSEKYCTNAGVMFFVNGRGTKELWRDCMFYIESPYHFYYSGVLRDQGMYRALLAKHAILGNINVHMLDCRNWNPGHVRTYDLVFDGMRNAWINQVNNKKQYVWHDPSYGGYKVWNAHHWSPSVDEVWRYVGGSYRNDWIREVLTIGPPKLPYYEQVLNDDRYVDKLCFTMCIEPDEQLGAMGLIKSIRKQYSPWEADVVVFIDKDFDDFKLFCEENSVALHYFEEIDEWVLPLVYFDPVYQANNRHFFHPDFYPLNELPFTTDRVPGFTGIRHYALLNMRAYCCGYCLCVKNYKQVVYVSPTVFLLGRLDSMLDSCSQPDTVVGFDNNLVIPLILKSLFFVDTPGIDRAEEYAFGADVIFFTNGRGTKNLMRDYMFYIDSSYHIHCAGGNNNGQLGLLRSIVAKHVAFGNVDFHCKDSLNWHPNTLPAPELIHDPEADIWINTINHQPQYIWRDVAGAANSKQRIWTGRNTSAIINKAWTWAGGRYETWDSIEGDMSRQACSFVANIIARHCSPVHAGRLRVLHIGCDDQRALVGYTSLLREQGFDPRIDVCLHPSRTKADAQLNDTISRFRLHDHVHTRTLRPSDSLLELYAAESFDVVYFGIQPDWASMLSDLCSALRLVRDRSIIAGSGLDNRHVMNAIGDLFSSEQLEQYEGYWVIKLSHGDQTNKLTSPLPESIASRQTFVAAIGGTAHAER